MDDYQSKFKVYAMEAAIAVHSIIIGFTIGVKVSQEEVSMASFAPCRVMLPLPSF